MTPRLIKSNNKKQNNFFSLSWLLAHVVWLVIWASRLDITSVSGDGSGEAIEQTELIFIIGMGSSSSLHWALPLSAMSELSFFTGVWRLGSEKGKSSDYYSYVTLMLIQHFRSSLTSYVSFWVGLIANFHHEICLLLAVITEPLSIISLSGFMANHGTQSEIAKASVNSCDIQSDHRRRHISDLDPRLSSSSFCLLHRYLLFLP